MTGRQGDNRESRPGPLWGDTCPWAAAQGASHWSGIWDKKAGYTSLGLGIASQVLVLLVTVGRERGARNSLLMRPSHHLGLPTGPQCLWLVFREHPFIIFLKSS